MFTKADFETDMNFTKEIMRKILAKGKSWLSIYPIKGVPTFRACITNYNTTEKEINDLVDELNKEFSAYAQK